ncbi:MAG: bifunctional phosphopantothenoylcysteine decarboxylase/phosphopantothenate--cysteine ligase CoaBC [Chloroflexota bacterium]|nr:bifunctional phosphopantothenoylcysteine decarboxylase/phosphopantothenate--cysteine ligase CoaBC [Chloroflexota bacterium]
MPNPLVNRKIALGVTGSIACYKAVDLASKLTQAGVLVDVIMTREACQFLTPLTFQSITHRPVVTDVFDPQSELSIDHVAIAERADAIIIAPATANTIAKIAHGFADDALTTTVLATQAPLIVAPAMDAHMYDNAATQRNISMLKDMGCVVAGPASGRLASGLIGKGRLLESPELLGCLRQTLGRNGDLANRKIVVSAGGTQEPIDPVRVIANHSSGKMGYALAEAARDRGASVSIVSAPTALPDPFGVKVVNTQTALHMQAALHAECADADALIMAAAVADWRPSSAAEQKVKKGDSDTWEINLVKNPDIIAGITYERLIKVGFAAESEDLLQNAASKMLSKSLHLIAANDITAEGSGFGVDTNRVILLDLEGGKEELPLMSKYDVGSAILDRVVGYLH